MVGSAILFPLASTLSVDFRDSSLSVSFPSVRVTAAWSRNRVFYVVHFPSRGVASSVYSLFNVLFLVHSSRDSVVLGLRGTIGHFTCSTVTSMGCFSLVLPVRVVLVLVVFLLFIWNWGVVTFIILALKTASDRWSLLCFVPFSIDESASISVTDKAMLFSSLE